MHHTCSICGVHTHVPVVWVCRTGQGVGPRRGGAQPTGPACTVASLWGPGCSNPRHKWTIWQDGDISAPPYRPSGAPLHCGHRHMEALGDWRWLNIPNGSPTSKCTPNSFAAAIDPQAPGPGPWQAHPDSARTRPFVFSLVQAYGLSAYALRYNTWQKTYIAV